MTKRNNNKNEFAYSTNPDFYPVDGEEETPTTLPPDKQDLRVMRESKHRAGKTVTVVTGFIGKEEDLNQVGKLLKTKCGTGGTVKNGDIIIQGDFRDKIFMILTQAKYKVKKAGG